MITVIKNCSICAKLTRDISEKPEMKHIIPEGPHFRYQADLWELSNNNKYNFTYKYILEINDCFSKLLSCYPLENKEGKTVLPKNKDYFLLFGPPNIFQTDQGKEFCNIAIKLYLENLNVKYIRNSPRYPESNGQIEAQHKTLQKQFEISLNKINNNEELIYNCLYVFNYIINRNSNIIHKNKIKKIR